MLNPNGDLHYCENSKPLGTCSRSRPGRSTSPPRPQTPRDDQQDGLTDVSEPCQVNVGAMKQVVPYVKFLTRDLPRVKHDPARHREPIPDPVR